MRTSFDYQTVQPGMNRLAAAFASPTKNDAETKELQSLTNIDYLRARMGKANAEAQAAHERSGYLGNQSQFLSDQSGVAVPIVQKFLDAQKTGNYGMDVQPPSTGSFDDTEGTRAPITEAPADLAPQIPKITRALQTLSATRASASSNPDQIAKAGGEYQGQQTTEEVLGNIRNREYEKASALNQGGKLGNQIKLYDNIGNTGAVFSPASGDVKTGGVDKVQQGQKAPSGYTWGPPNDQGQRTLTRIPGGPADVQPQNGDAVEMAAHRYVQDGTLPPNLGRGAQGSATTMAILSRAAEIAKEQGQDGQAARITQVANKASQSALNQLSKQEAMVGAFERNFNKNADMLLEQSQKVDRTGVPLLNKWIMAGKKNVGGDPDIAVLDTAVKATVNEYTKIISGSMGNSAMAEGEIKKVNDLLNSAQTPEQVTAVVNFMKKETANRMSGFAEQKAQLTGSMRGASAGAPKGEPAKIASDDDYAKLAPGTPFIGPDGKRRRKP